MKIAYWNHFIRFCKRNYSRWDSQKELIEQLKIVHCHVCGLDPKYSNEYDILSILLWILEEHLDKNKYTYMIKDYFKEKYNYNKLIKSGIKNIEDDIEYFVSRVCELKIKEKDEKGNYYSIINLEEKDYDLLRKLTKIKEE